MLACVLVAGVTPAGAATTAFGEEGEHSEQFKNPGGLAINQETGGVYIGETEGSQRLDVFGASGNWLLAWGWDVNAGSPAEELQTCTSSCQAARSGSGAGAFGFEGLPGVAVDNTPGSLSKGDVYAVDPDNLRVQKFDSEGNFLLMFGGGVLSAGAEGEGTFTAGSHTITSVTTTSRAFLVGQTITAADGAIPAATTITAVGEGTITLSHPATASATTKLSVAAATGNAPNNERQTIALEGNTPTGGTFMLTFRTANPSPSEATTAAINFDASAAEVRSALEALPNMHAAGGEVAVSGAAGGPYTVEFTGARYADTDVEALEGNGEALEPAGEESVAVTTPLEGHSEPEVCSVASMCQAGAKGTSAGQFFEPHFNGSYIAVGPGGDVYVGDKARVQVFDPSGAPLPAKNISLAGLSSEGQVTALAVDSAGDVFVKDSEVGGVHEFEPDGTEKSFGFDTGSFEIQAVALDATGNVYVEDSEGGDHFLEYDPAGNELAAFGSNTIEFSLGGLAYANGSGGGPGALYADGSSLSPKEAPRVFTFTPPPPGPLIEHYGESGTTERHGAAKFNAVINPEGHETTYHLQYISAAQFNADGEAFGAGTLATATSAPITEGLFEDHPAEVVLPEATLVPGTTYHWRLVATDSQPVTTTGPDNTLEETPSALIDGPWASEVTPTSATLAARINPEGASTSYRLQYGTSTAYGHEFVGNVGAGTEFVAIGYHVQELTPGTTYHYRVVTVNECVTGETCTQDGADHTFTTRPGAIGAALPDGRAWELVTPADAGGATLELSEENMRAASDGSAITYEAHGATLGENPVSNFSLSATQVLSRRGPGAWGSQDTNGPILPVEEGENYSKATLQAGAYSLFSPDLASALYSPQNHDGVLTPDALEGTQYLRHDFTCTTSEPTSCYQPLLSPANTPPGTKLIYPEGNLEKLVSQERELAGTPDLAHVVLGSPLSLTVGAPTFHAAQFGEFEIEAGYGNLYEWTEGRLQLVSILPNGLADESRRVVLAGQGNDQEGRLPRALSSDGRRVAWTVGSPYPQGDLTALYVRDMTEGKTVHIGGPGAAYQTMSTDGSHVFFLEHGDLYDYHVAPGAAYDAGVTSDLTAAHGAGEASAGAQEIVSDVSEDGSYVYFVATGVLSSAKSATGEGALAGADNLYVLHYEGGAWGAPRFIARLAGEDEHSWAAHAGGIRYPELKGVTSRVSPDGRYLTFMSSRSLTGYDNLDVNPAARGAHDEEVFLYHAPADLAAEAGSLICASCDPTGARPHGVFDEAGAKEPFAAGPDYGWGELGHPHWLAGSLPAWEGRAGSVYQPRYLSDEGRLFFNSPVALVPQDTNGLEDVYEYEPAGAGAAKGCTSSSATYRAGEGGCIALISSGQSASESAFMDASGKGPGREEAEDVFFLSSDRLTGADTDVGYDVWDAHVCSASSPCSAPPVSPPPCSSGDSCKPAPAPQPDLFGPGPSETFSGAGNLVPPPPAKPVVKPLSRAQKLAKAVSTCRKKYKHSKKRRSACEKQAKKRYGKAKPKTATTKRRAGR